MLQLQHLGDTQNFGDAPGQLRYARGCSNATRGLAFGGSNPSPAITDDIIYVTLATLGNAVNFGNLSTATNVGGSCSSSTRGLCGGGQTPGFTNVIEYVSILTEGNAVDFGDLTRSDGGINALSNAHGGL